MRNVLIRLGFPMQGVHGHHKADSVVSLPFNIARQIVEYRQGVVVDRLGAKVDFDFEAEDEASAEADDHAEADEAQLGPTPEAADARPKKARKPRPPAAPMPPADPLAEWAAE